jgi:hypothetical protein
LEGDNWWAGRVSNDQAQNTIRVTLDDDLHILYGGCGGMCGRYSRPGESEAVTTATANSGESSTPAICRDVLRELCWRAAQIKSEVQEVAG